ncbi:unnamed protein product [Amoebophrya sp. A25]|nr:unnamed protein product [Amoebophrya sp. A25]|eukprot:GSA25T00022870001.1
MASLSSPGVSDLGPLAWQNSLGSLKKPIRFNTPEELRDVENQENYVYDTTAQLSWTIASFATNAIPRQEIDCWSGAGRDKELDHSTSVVVFYTRGVGASIHSVIL